MKVKIKIPHIPEEEKIPIILPALTHVLEM